MEEYAAMIAAQEDREITVIASSYPYEACLRVGISLFAGVELCVHGDAYAEDERDEWKRIFVFLRHALALCQHPGKMVLVFDDIGADVDQDAVRAAFDSLSDEQRTVTLEAIAQAFEREQRAAAAAAARLERHADFIRAQKEDDAEQLTLREAFERHRAGTERLRRLAGEEGKEHP